MTLFNKSWQLISGCQDTGTAMVHFSPLTVWVFGNEGGEGRDVMDDSAQILFQSLLRETIVSSSGWCSCTVKESALGFDDSTSSTPRRLPSYLLCFALSCSTLCQSPGVSLAPILVSTFLPKRHINLLQLFPGYQPTWPWSERLLTLPWNANVWVPAECIC